MLGVFLDTETNGLDPFIHIPLEIACKIINLKTGSLLGEYESIIRSKEEEWMSCDEKSLLVNGFTKEEFDSGKSKGEIQQEIQALFRQHDICRGRAFFICQNPSFDRPFFGKIMSPYEQERLLLPYHWLDLASMYWVLQLVHTQDKKEWDLSVSKDSIASSLGLARERSPHRAMNGVNHLLDCYARLVGFPG